ncbi:armadillo repeat-containing protein 2 isoform X2 [Clupea harengus]|uniref:Armadillo repeat-containing protein 2 isoform X2 n=1 Tax=Clupea harengus TaxID=7950 RepID=A0A6P8GG48_CLUHA|nr:armadillo repeat-containing protein 2 isoform X2 [Clupea harengus]
MERRRETRKPFYRVPGASNKTSAEIVQEARQSLRTLRTQRPFTPLDEHRQLFGEGSSRPRDGRPPSAFSLHARNFEAPDSRPGSGTRLSPLDHKPRLPAAALDGGALEEAVALPKPPTEQTEGRKGLGVTRARLLRAGSNTRLPPVSSHMEVRKPEDCESPTHRSVSFTERLGTGAPPSARAAAAKETEQAESSLPHPQLHGPSTYRGEISLPDRSDSNTQATTCGTRTDKEVGDGDGSGTGSDVTEDSFWNSMVSPVLQEFEAVVTGGSPSEEVVRRLCDECSRLHGALHERGMLGRRLRKRATLLRSLFRLIDLGSDQLNLLLAKLILALKVSGNNLLNICKLIFKISRSASNDALFHNNSIIDSLLSVLRSEDVSVCGEALLYCVATLKFLSGNSALRRLLLEKDCIGILSQLTHRFTHPPSDRDSAGPTHTTTGHILVQLTATLRNMADLSESRPPFLSNGVLAELTTVLDHHHGDPDICTNVARIFSKLSSYNECCLALAEVPQVWRIFIDLLGKHSKKQDLVVRLLFTLGNLAARCPEARECIYEERGGVNTLLRLFYLYQEPRVAPQASSGVHRLGASEREDVLVKLIRVLANISIHPTAGTALAASEECVELLLKVLEQGSVELSEELMVNAAATINNLSFYQGESSVVRRRHTRISHLLLKLLLSCSMAAVLEATRVFGNLSQIPDVRHFIMEQKVHQFVVTLLDSKSSDVCFSACGVLINLSAEPHNRHTLRQEGVIQKLGDCLRDFGPCDWQLAGLLCQTLWNCTEENMENETEELLHTLSMYLDEEEALSWSADSAMRELHQACWELDFRPVAQRLRRRILGQVTLSEPIREPS